MKPAVGSDEIGFAEHIGKFDALLDTTSDERPSLLGFGTSTATIDITQNDKEFYRIVGSTSTLGLLRSRHSCRNYISTHSTCQKLIGEQGIIFGPGKVNDYVKKLNPSSTDCQSILPPTNLGKTITSLFDKGVVFKPEKATSKDPVFVRNWSLSEFWEHSSWPRDSSGMNVRYGLPVIDEDEDDEDSINMVAAPPTRSSSRVSSKSKLEEIEALKKQRASQPTNPYVKDIIGVQGVEEDIIESKQNSVLFLSAKWCKTCKSLNPQYTRLARESTSTTSASSSDDDSSSSSNNILFAKAETSGLVGKELGKYLEVDAVPAFVFFKDGKLFGTPLSVSRIPSTKLQRAIDLLSTNQDWDSTIIMEQDSNRNDDEDDEN